MTSTPNKVALALQEGTVTQKVYKELLSAGGSLPLECYEAVMVMVRDLEEAHINTLGQLAGVRGGRDLVLDSFQQTTAENAQLLAENKALKKVLRDLLRRRQPMLSRGGGAKAVLQ